MRSLHPHRSTPLQTDRNVSTNDHSRESDARHDHTDGPRGQAATRLKWTLALVVLYIAAEVVGGLLSGSLALLADAGHMMSDAASLGLALFAIRMARRPATPARTWGYYRAEILAALANAVLLVLAALFVFREAWHRFDDPPEVAGPLMIAVATGGLIVNLVGMALLHSGRDESLNVHGAWLHVLADAAGSAGAIVAGVLVWAFGWNLADPVASVLIGLLVLVSAWRLLAASVAVLMEGAPGDLDVDEVRNALVDVGGVDAVHDLHLWTLTSGLVALSAHVVAGEAGDPGDLLGRIQTMLDQRFGVDHCTIQVEPPAHAERALPV